jgi:hypothetical protein
VFNEWEKLCICYKHIVRHNSELALSAANEVSNTDCEALGCRPGKAIGRRNSERIGYLKNKLQRSPDHITTTVASAVGVNGSQFDPLKSSEGTYECCSDYL